MVRSLIKSINFLKFEFKIDDLYIKSYEICSNSKHSSDGTAGSERFYCTTIRTLNECTLNELFTKLAELKAPICKRDEATYKRRVSTTRQELTELY